MNWFPNPVEWTIDQVSHFVGGAANQGFELVVGGLTAWVLDAVLWVVSGVFAFFLDSSDPNVQADWFVAGNGPYATTAAIGASLLVLFLLLGIIQGIVNGDVAGMAKRMAVDLPVSVFGIVGLVTITQTLIALTDALSNGIIDTFEEDVHEFIDIVGSLDRLSGGQSGAFIVFLLCLVTVLAGIALVAELVIRSALIYIVVALAPLVFAARVWPAARGATRKLLELLVALIISKLVIAVALSVAAAAAVGTAGGGQVTALPTPEVVAEDPGGSVSQAVGILLTAGAAFAVAAFAPLLVVRLLPATEAAAVAHGLRGGPVRAAHQTLLVGNAARGLSSRRLSQIGSSKVPTGAGTPSGAPGGPASGSGAAGKATSGAGASGAGAAGAGAAGAAVAAVTVAAAAGTKAKGAVSTGASAAASTAEEASSGSSRRPPSSRRSSADKAAKGASGDD